MIGNQQRVTDPDSLLTVRFYMRSEKDNFQTEKQGRPIFFSEPYIEIMVPGNQHMTIDTPVREEHKRRFPKQWAVFENSQRSADEMQIPGTPIDQWPAVTREQAESLKGQRFYTVEQLANCTDAQAQALGMNASAFRLKAQAYIASAKDSAVATAQAEEIAKLKAEQDAKDAKHAAEIAELRALITAATEQKRRPGRPRKEQPAA